MVIVNTCPTISTQEVHFAEMTYQRMCLSKTSFGGALCQDNPFSSAFGQDVLILEGAFHVDTPKRIVLPWNPLRMASFSERSLIGLYFIKMPYGGCMTDYQCDCSSGYQSSYWSITSLITSPLTDQITGMDTNLIISPTANYITKPITDLVTKWITKPIWLPIQ